MVICLTLIKSETGIEDLGSRLKKFLLPKERGKRRLENQQPQLRSRKRRKRKDLLSRNSKISSSSRIKMLRDGIMIRKLKNLEVEEANTEVAEVMELVSIKVAEVAADEVAIEVGKQESIEVVEAVGTANIEVAEVVETVSIEEVEVVVTEVAEAVVMENIEVVEVMVNIEVVVVMVNIEAVEVMVNIEVVEVAVAEVAAEVAAEVSLATSERTKMEI